MPLFEFLVFALPYGIGQRVKQSRRLILTYNLISIMVDHISLGC